MAASARSKLARTVSTIGEGLVETLYPTRCAVCDRPGTLLCASCEASLSYIDYWRACPRCGGLWGWLQCTECNPVTLKANALDRIPFDSCRNAVLFDEAARRIVTAYKDQGEQRLAVPIAHVMSRMVSPELLRNLDAIAYIPATRAALRRRDFDHAQLIADALAAELGPPVAAALLRPHTRDQRKLGKGERHENMRGAFCADPTCAGQIAGRRILLIDDVMTTGSTLFDASTALRDAGAAAVHAVTFAHA